ncbi:MAG TPA: hypothetical protein PKK51_07840, partial [Rhodocyclaceae bacterium]|nr:hypothetical protein [Rhodocyclaceae bacterium]
MEQGIKARRPVVDILPWQGPNTGEGLRQAAWGSMIWHRERGSPSPTPYPTPKEGPMFGFFDTVTWAMVRDLVIAAFLG